MLNRALPTHEILSSITGKIDDGQLASYRRLDEQRASGLVSFRLSSAYLFGVTPEISLSVSQTVARTPRHFKAISSRLTGLGEARCSSSPFFTQDHRRATIDCSDLITRFHLFPDLNRMAETVRFLAVGLAEVFVRGPWEANELAKRAKSVLRTSRRRHWVVLLTRRLVLAFPGTMPPRAAILIEFLAKDELLLRICADCLIKGQPVPEVDLNRLPHPEMQPSAGAASTWNVRPLVTVDEVAQWLGLTHAELDWFADRRRQESKQSEEKLRHYRYRWIAKTSGGRRLLEIPKPRLKTIQRKILDDILDQIPPHSAAHAFRRGRSIASYVARHTDKQIVLYTDLCEFFPSVRGSQVHAIFRTAGYPERVASLLSGLCTNRTPPRVFSDETSTVANDLRWKRYGSAHLPQGSPTSPSLANLAAFWLDCRLLGLAKTVGADYTRYADDLVFSGGAELARCSARFQVFVAAIAHHEGFEIRRRKTRAMSHHSSQQVAGIILNHHPNIPRQEYDILRATLHNCQKQGPETQNLSNHPNFRDHLQGRIAYWSTICPERAGKLRVLFERISWP